MSKQPKRWHFAPDPPSDFIDKIKTKFDLPPAMVKVIYNRSLQTLEDIEAFLHSDMPRYHSLFYNPFDMKGVEKAVIRIFDAIDGHQPIIVYGDFDADGVTSTALLVTTLQNLGARAKAYIPDRVDEGYGLNTPALEKFAVEGVKLVITVDCGIRSVDEISAGAAAGLDIIITDHHNIGDMIPDAYAVINPKQADCPYPEKMLAGVGIAFKLASALLIFARDRRKLFPTIKEADLLDLVAIGTVADLAPLGIGVEPAIYSKNLENRRLVQLGLAELAKARRPGIHALMDISNVKPEKIKALNIGFALGPRLNAAGRLESAMTAYDLLMADDPVQASELAKELQRINLDRQQLTLQAYENAKGQVTADKEMPYLLFAADKNFRPGIVGLVAGKLTEEFYRPSMVLEVGDTESHGSCRSIPEFNITQALDHCGDLLIRHGGHAQAAGFTIRNENIEAFKARLEEIAKEQLGERELAPTLKIDAKLELSELTLTLAQKLQQLEPLGTDNPEPIFVTKRLKVAEAKPVGAERNHLKLYLKDGPVSINAIAFGFGSWEKRIQNYTYVDIAYHLQLNEWNGRVSVQMNVVDIHPSER